MEKRITLTYNGKQYLNFTAEELIAAKIPQDVIDAEMQRLGVLTQRAKLRAVIGKTVGDTPSILGTVSDAAGLLTAIALSDIAALSSTDSFAAYKAKKIATLGALAGDVDIAALAEAALARIQSGEMILTASIKGLPTVLDETLTRSTKVAKILKESTGADGNS